MFKHCAERVANQFHVMKILNDFNHGMLALRLHSTSHMKLLAGIGIAAAAFAATMLYLAQLYLIK